MTEVVLRVRTEFDGRAVNAGIAQLRAKSKVALDPMRQAAIRAKTALKNLGVEGDKAGKKIKSSMQGGAFAIRGIATEMEGALRGLVIGLTAVTAAGGLLARQALNWSAEFEVLKITFETLTGSVIVADNMIREMKDFAVRTPLQLRDVEEAGTTLLALGEAAQDVIPIISNLGQAAVAMNKPLEQFIRARQLLSQGVVLTRTLAPLGISRDILAQFGAGAAATGAQLVAAFDKALGKFEGLFERTFDTVRGRMSNLKDELAVMFAAIGDPMRDIFISTVDQMRDFLGEVRTFFEENKVAIQAAFQSIKDSAEAFLAPVTAVLGKFFADIRDNPERIQELADAFVNLGKAAARLLIFGTVTVGLLKFLVAVTLIRIAMPQLLASLGIGIKALGGLRLAFTVLNPVALAVTVAIGLITAAIVIHNELVMKAKQRSIELRAELEKNLEAWEATKIGVEGLNSTYNRLKDSTKTNTEKFVEFRNEMQLIINLNPEFLKQLRLTETSSGQLVTVGGAVVDTWEEIQTAWLAIDSSNAVNQVNNLTTALINLSREEFLGRRTPLDRFLGWVVPGHEASIMERRIREWFEMRTGVLAGEQPGFVDIGRFFEQFPGAAAGAPPGAPPGGGGRAESGKIRREGIELIKWLRDLARAAEQLAEDAVTVSRNLLPLAEIAGGLSDKFGKLADIFGPPEPLGIETKEGRAAREAKATEGIEAIEEVANEFIANLSRTLGDFLAQWGAQGGAPDIRGAGMQMLRPAATQWGADLAAMWNTGGFMAGPIAGAIMGGAGFIANRLIGEEPLKIEQPVDIRIVDIETRLKNFFNFRGLDPFTYRSSFQMAFENGEF